MKEFGLQLYSIRSKMETEEDFRVAMKTIADMGYKDLHTAGMPAFSEKVFIDVIKENGMRICGTHYNWDKIQNNIQETMDLHRLWETTNVGIGGYANDRTYEGVKAFIEKFNSLAAIYAKEGFKLTYHNHAWEFKRLEGHGTLTMWDMLVDGLDPENTSFVLDTCWVQAGCGDVRHWIEKLAGRIDILHLKDCYPVTEPTSNKILTTMTEIGNGGIYWDGVIETARKAGVKAYVVEQDTCPGDPFDSVKISADYLKRYL